MISQDITKFALKANGLTKAKIQKAFIGLSRDIIMDTPVDTGRLRNNWIPSVNSGTNETLDSTDKSGLGAIGKVSSLSFKLGDTLYLTNNLPYAKRIEFDSWSAKAPAGMVRKNILRWSKYFD